MLWGTGLESGESREKQRAGSLLSSGAGRGRGRKPRNLEICVYPLHVVCYPIGRGEKYVSRLYFLSEI
jgi:hypothetical protein